MFSVFNRSLLAALAALLSCTMNATSDSVAPQPAHALQSAYFGGGCFWCLEAYFETLPGVKTVVSGYAGGQTPNPSYEDVCTGETGHAEVVRIDFDPATVSYETLLGKFWLIHDPTTLNRQGPDAGTQYRSIILYTDDAQRAAAERSRTAIQERLADRVVTEIVSLKKFYEAEEYHQDYFRRNPNQGYCRAVIAPKLKKLGVK
jgi:peptide-methionine (S)-S-oxide reductase